VVIGLALAVLSFHMETLATTALPTLSNRPAEPNGRRLKAITGS